MQLALFGNERPSFDPEFRGVRRLELGQGAWLDHGPGFLRGHESLFAALRDGLAWQSERRMMYEREVAVPRLLATLPGDGGGHEVLEELEAALCRRYRWRLDRVGVAYYRDGRDSVAMHGDKVGDLRHDCVIAVLAIGSPRRFLLRSRAGGRRAGGPTLSFTSGWGDLFVMGGTCQATWEHGIPKASHAGPRISVQFRPSAR